MAARRARRAAGAAWVEGVLAQARNPDAAENTRPFAINGARLADRFPDEWSASRELLVAPLRAAVADAGGDPDRDADAIYHLAIGAMEDALVRRAQPDRRDDVEHLRRVRAPKGAVWHDERELLLTGIGGQGVQLAAQVIARRATLEGRDVMFFGVYGGMMRGGNTDSTVVVADGPITAPPVVVARLVGDRDARRVLGAGRAASCGPAALVLVNDSTFEHDDRRAASPCVRVAGHRARGRARQPAGADDGDGGRVQRASPAWSARRGGRGDAAVDPVVPHVSTSPRTSARCRAGYDAVDAGALYPAWERAQVAGMSTLQRRSEVARHGHDRRRRVQGLRAVHPRVPADGADDVDAREPHGLPLPRAARRLHRVRGVPDGVPRLLLRGVPLRHAGRDRGGGPRMAS